ncbi:hypothetical protein PIB30_018675 [Stylosanthes scabra]|uniref:RRM domain-containing protein n=1 Tax=Stylosanthes scabra TaxID=79078 RepID=A0ABU6VA87_9FABA|nr:hypothetical protein [Stylosanthes scabra]
MHSVLGGTIIGVGFASLASARLAIAELNGKAWGERKLAISMSRYRRHGAQVNPRTRRKEAHGRIRKMWVKVMKGDDKAKEYRDVEVKETPVMGETRDHIVEKVRRSRKVIEACVEESQRNMLERSLMGVNVDPIDFPKTLKKIKEVWEGDGEILCRDVGPTRCLLTFETTKARDEAYEKSALLEIFDELRPH